MDLLRPKSIKFWAMVLIVIMTITTMSLFGFLSYLNISNSLKVQLEFESESVLDQTMLTFKNRFSEIEKTLEHLDQSLNNDSISSESKQDIIQLYQSLPQINERIYYSENGKMYIGKNITIPNGFIPSDREWYKLAMEHKGEVVWTEPYLDYVTQEIIITASKSVKHEDGTVGVVAADFKLNELSSFISSSTIGEEGLVMLVSSNGTILANRENHLIGESLFGDQFEKMVNETNSRQVPYVIQEKQYLLHSETFQQNGMCIVTAISKEEINQSLLKSLLPILIAGLGCLLLFSFIAYLGILRGGRPLKKLGALMSSVENGNYNVYAREKDYKEIERLSKGFNNMIQAIKKRDQELNISNKELKLAEGKLRTKYEELKQSQKILKASEEKVKHLAAYDSLTGLINRRSLLSLLEKTIKSDVSLKAIIFIDLDNFKTVNDSLGHSFGDKLILEVANKLKCVSPMKKDVARISGDEFILVIHDLKSEEEADSIAKEIIGIFEEPISVDSKCLNITASIGVAIYPLHAKSSEELLKIADMAMYRAKGSGKNGYRIFDESIKKEVEEKLEIEIGIRNGLRNNEFELFFQPLFNTEENRITSVEALLRSNSPVLSKFNILQIIQTAEVTGQIVELDKWVVGEACTAIQRMNQHFDSPINISINISAVHIMQQDFVQNIREIIEETGVPPQWVELEITETSLMESFDINREKLFELKKLGIALHLDDFGTGYSSLNYLNSLPIDRVKIDKSFVDAMLESEKDSKIVETIINLSHNIGLQVVAEGVEYQNQLETLEQYRCNLIQGYYISKPVNYEQIIQIIPQYLTKIQ